ncbi:ORF6C domain-containing protein [Bacillus sp. JJ1773]|uniref:ORF6C domain-containing protein n=1 Tax=Bacillus sp. JJ1773 TaxID=3122965 RepID=UPI003F68B6DC
MSNLSTGEQRRIQIAVTHRVFELSKNKKDVADLYKELYRGIKKTFGVASYKEVNRRNLLSAINYIEQWLP